MWHNIMKENSETGLSGSISHFFTLELEADLLGVAAREHWCSSGCVLLPGLEVTGGRVG